MAKEGVMRGLYLSFGMLVLLALSTGAYASSTLRVGNQVLVTGDSSERVIALLGRPSSKSHRRSKRSRSTGRGAIRIVDKRAGGEQWRYRRGDRVTVVTIIDGRVVEIDDDRI